MTMAAETQVALLQFIALMIPAVGLYMLLYAWQSPTDDPFARDTFYSAKYAVMAFVGAAILLVILMAGNRYLSFLISTAISGVAIVLLLAGLLLFGESVWSFSEIT
jgi:hypothetical protein